MSTGPKLRLGLRVLVPWGVDTPRSGTIVDVWGDPDMPSQIRVELDAIDDTEGAVLLLSPRVVAPAA